MNLSRVGQCCRLTAVLSLLILFGCAVRSPEPNYYSLGIISPVDREVHNMTRLDISLGVGPLTIPEYLKRAQIVTRVDDNQYKFDDFHRWVGLLEQNITTVLTGNLEILLGTDKVASFPWLNYFKPDYRIAIDVVQFDSTFDGDAVLIARWSISDATGQTLLASGKSQQRVALQGQGYDALVKAESELLALLSKELVVQIKNLHH